MTPVKGTTGSPPVSPGEVPTEAAYLEIRQEFDSISLEAPTEAASLEISKEPYDNPPG